MTVEDVEKGKNPGRTVVKPACAFMPFCTHNIFSIVLSPTVAVDTTECGQLSGEVAEQGDKLVWSVLHKLYGWKMRGFQRRSAVGLGTGQGASRR